MKKVLFTHRTDSAHWVGDGFPVRNLFHYNDIAKNISPFLLMDYAGPADFPPNNHPKGHRLGVGTHPHRGFETVTVVYTGQVEHRDSAGGGGVIENDEVQWMTAASGLVHEERHGKDFSKTGGRFEMVQLWVNLPKKDKMTKPRYQALTKKQIPTVELPNNAGTLRVIAGEYQNSEGQKHSGPAKTFSPINMWDLRLNQNSGPLEIKVPKNHTAVIFVLSGDVKVSGSHTLSDAELAVFETAGDTLVIESVTASKILFLGGDQLNEPFIGHGPFVMSTQDEIIQAFDDFEAGKMGSMEPIDGSDL